MLYNKPFQKLQLNNVRTLSLFSMLVAMGVAARLALMPLPNMKPTTTLIVMMTLLFGIRGGILYATFTMFLSNIILGMGIWTVMQIGSYIVVVLLAAGFFKLCSYRVSLVVGTVFLALLGYVYGFIISIFQIPIIGVEKFVPYYMAGIPFDTSHAIGNAIFYFFLMPTVYPLVHRLSQRYFETT